MRGTAAILALLGTILTSGGPAIAGVPEVEVWQNTVRRLIASHQNYPRSAELRRQQGTTRLRVVFAANGRVSEVDVVESSGSPILDLEARATINGIGRLPTPPAGITSVNVPIVWRLD